MNGAEFLKAHGISQSMLALEMKVTRQNVNIWFNGSRAPNARSIWRIAQAMNRLGAQVTPAEVYMALSESANGNSKRAEQ